MSVAEFHFHECAALVKYVQASKGPLTSIFCETHSPTQKFLMKYLDSPKSAKVEETNNKDLAKLYQMPLHGLFFQEQAKVVQVDLERSHCWIQNAQLKGKMEALLCAAQEQVLATNNVRHKIYK
eukprot:9222321-Ditylum_brightwellii.AAC.2